MISTATIRRLSQPILFRYWMRRIARNTVKTRVGGFELRVLPSVFHPRFFGSSAILGEFIEKLDLNGKTFLDMGTGSGVVGLFAARAKAQVTGVDINPVAIECARANAVQAGYSIEYIVSDLFSSLEGSRFDVIAWNPPFFAKPAESHTEAAFFAGRDYAVIARFARACAEHLHTNGCVFLVLTLDVDMDAIGRMFEAEGFRVRRAAQRKWGLGETMVVLDIR